jgi:ubiquinone/menaquinone biosynthesis C-methylase UbiE
MTHKFDIKNKHKLDNEIRRKMLPPSDTLIKLGLKKDDIVADIGCGIGYFSIPAYEIVGERGKVFAVDILSEMLKEVGEKLKEKNISNVQCVKINGSNLNIEDEIMTYVFMCNVLHEVDNPKMLLNEIMRVMKSEANIVIVEWEKVDSKIGPPVGHRLDKKEVEKILEESNFKNINHVSLSENFYAVIGGK